MGRAAIPGRNDGRRSSSAMAENEPPRRASPSEPGPEKSSGSGDFPPLPGLGRRLVLARLVLFWERLWPALWPATGVAGGFLVLALLDLMPRLGPGLHAVVLGLFILAIAVLLWNGLRRLAAPTTHEARRRLESASGVFHRPLDLLEERLAAGREDPASLALWQRHRQRVLGRLGSLRTGWPSPGLATRDPWGLRGALFVLLVLAFALGWQDGGDRLARALVPGVLSPSTAEATLDLWITPPAYTQRPPLHFSQGSTDTVAIAERATIQIQVSGRGPAPRLVLNRVEQALEPVAEGTWRLDTTLTGALLGAFGEEATRARLDLRQGRARLASWPLRLVPDHPPEVTLAAPPDVTSRGAIRVTMEASDDYGVEEATLILRRPRLGDQAFADQQGHRPPGPLPRHAEDEAALEALNAPLSLSLPLPAGDRRVVKETSHHDLTAHPWAGTTVHAQILVRDAAGQDAVTASIPMRMPERSFRHPVAEALVLLRRTLVQSPARRGEIADELFHLSAIPGAYDNDTVVYLALLSMAQRLAGDSGLAEIGPIERLMWDTALRLEDGALSLVERRLRALQDRLQQALRDEAPNAEIAELMRELQQALAEFLQELMQNMPDQPNLAMPFDPQSQTITPQDLFRMLDRARELAMTGNPEAARQMLSMLREMLENLRSGEMAQGQSQERQDAGEMMRDLQELMRRQQQLMDESYQRSHRGPTDSEEDRRSAEEQRRLRQELGEVLRRFGEMTGNLPGALGEAEQEMRQAEEALGQGQPGEAVDPQGRALDHMRQGMGEMAQQFMRQFGQGMMPGQRGQGRGRGTGGLGSMPPFMALDPLGRPIPNSGTGSGDDVTIPDITETERAWEILRELRRRAGEAERPTLERDYLERLLRRF